MPTFLTVLFCICSVHALAADPTTILEGYIVSMVGSTTGSIEGSATTPDGTYSNAIPINALNYNLNAPFNATTGAPLGTVDHTPLTIVKQVDRSSALLFTLLHTIESVSPMVIKYYYKPGGGSPAELFTMTLTGANIVGIRLWQPNSNDPAASAYAHPEEVSFVYDTLDITHEPTGITTTINW